MMRVHFTHCGAVIFFVRLASPFLHAPPRFFIVSFFFPCGDDLPSSRVRLYLYRYGALSRFHLKAVASKCFFSFPLSSTALLDPLIAGNSFGAFFFFFESYAYNLYDFVYLLIAPRLRFWPALCPQVSVSSLRSYFIAT